MKRVLALACALLLLCPLAACSPGGGPQKTVAVFFEAAKAIDLQKMNACLVSEQELTWDLEDRNEQENETRQSLMQMLRTLSARLDYKIDSCERDGDTATAVVTVSYPDASLTVKDAMTDVMADLLATLFGAQTDSDPQTLMIQAMQEKLETETLPQQTAQLTLQLQKTEDGWKITSLPEELMNMMTGNAIAAFENAVESLTGEMG